MFCEEIRRFPEFVSSSEFLHALLPFFFPQSLRILNLSTVLLLSLSSAADHEVENVFDGESSNDTSIDREILDKPNNAVDDTDQTLTNCDSARALSP